jgi:hypothetical protein
MKRNIRLYEYDANLDRTLEPSDNYLIRTIKNSLEKSKYITRTNSSGYILPKGISHNNTVDSCIILGDSIPECIFMKEEHRIESVLYKQKNTEIYLNCAYSGATLLDIYNIILNKIIPTKPKKIFIMHGVFDRFIDKLGYYSEDKIACTTSEVMGKLNIENDFLNHRKIFLKSIINLLSDFNIEIFLSTFSHRHNPNDPNKEFCSRAANIDNLYCQINEITREIAARSSCIFLDFETILYDEFDIHYDNHHLTARGAELVANYLIENGF